MAERPALDGPGYPPVNDLFMTAALLSSVGSESRVMMNTKKAYFMGYRHIADLAAMNRIVDLAQDNRFNEYALELMEAWRDGAIAAQAMIEKESATIQ